MDSQTAYEIWAPHTSIWSAWAKPILFAHLPRARVPLPLSVPANTSWVSSVSQRVAIVIDLPNVESVAMGLALAELGYRPVPLFNACPPTPAVEPVTASLLAMVDVDVVLTALVEGCDRLRQVRLPDDAPPAFLIDALRQQPTRLVSEGLFDNRSVMFVTDFPSANFLLAQGIKQVILVRQQLQALERDLAYALRTWEKAGIELQVVALLEAAQLRSLQLPRINQLTGLWIRLCTGLRFQRNRLREFGSFVPESSGG